MTKISDLTSLTGAAVDGATDVVPIVDDSESGTAKNKQITVDELKISFDLGTAADLDIDTDDTLAADSDSLIPTQQAVKAYVDAVAGSVAELDDVGDVNAPSPSNGDVLTWDSTPGEWVPAAPTGGSNALDDLTDVDAPTPSDGDVLTFDSGSGDWVPAAPSAGATFRGALVKKSGNQTGANYTVAAKVAWDAESYDTDTIHDTVTNNTRLTVPSGASYVRLGCQVGFSNVTASVIEVLDILKNGSAAFDGYAQTRSDINNTQPHLQVWTPVIAVSPGDYFEVNLTVTTDTSIDIVAASSWFSMQVIA